MTHFMRTFCEDDLAFKLLTSAHDDLRPGLWPLH